MLVISALRRGITAKFKVSLGYMVSVRLAYTVK